MKFYLAPMEGITTYVYRNAYHRIFSPMDKYYTPFLVPHQKRDFNARERNDILPEHNKGLTLIPQILTNQAVDFIRLSKELMQFGYGEVNLNLGCPSGTVVAKNRGSGFLSMPEKLDQFLYEVFQGTDLKISLKTRIGVEEPEEFYELLSIYNKYPLKELIIHPRLQKDYYKNKPRLAVFSDAVKQSRIKLCYNGDIFSGQDYENITGMFPEIDRVMLGRGVIVNPGLIGLIREGQPLKLELLKEFHDSIYGDYQEILSGGRNILFRMKELWQYMIYLFPDSAKYEKRIKKAENLPDYEQAVFDLFRQQPLVPVLQNY